MERGSWDRLAALRLFKSCFGHKMGPLETADRIGLDTILLSLDVLYESFNDGKYRPCPLLKKMVHAGLYPSLGWGKLATEGVRVQEDLEETGAAHAHA